MSEEKTKEPFKKVEGGMVYQTEDGKILAVGLPIEIEELIAGEGKGKLSVLKGVGAEVKGEKYSKIKYNWFFVSEKEPKSYELSDLTEQITNTTCTHALQVATSVIQEAYNVCGNCNHRNTTNAKYCNICGNKLRTYGID